MSEGLIANAAPQNFANDHLQVTEPDTTNAFGGDLEVSSRPAPHLPKQSLWEFVSTNHSLLALFFAGPNEAPTVLLPCPCCEGNLTKGLSVRNRVFIFCFVLVAVFFVTVCVNLTQVEPSAVLIVSLSLLLVLPATCRLKSELPTLADRLQPLNSMMQPLRGEEIGLILLLLLILIVAAGGTSASKAGDLLSDYVTVVVCQMAADFVSLIWKFFCCSVCCRCCLPPSQLPAYHLKSQGPIMV